MKGADWEKQWVGASAALLPWMKDEEVTDILINGPDSFFVEKRGCLVREASPFPSISLLADFLERLILPSGRRVDATQPYLDGSIAEGSRFHVILPPIAAHGPYISIRKFKKLETTSLDAFGPPELIDWLREQVGERRNILIAGATGSGKTTLLTQLLRQVSPTERIAVIEESLEIFTDHPHVLRLEGRPASTEGRGEVTLRQLIRNALRMRPDRIVVGECRGEEAFDMLQAMNTGHGGSYTTIHANSALDALKRLESLVLFAGFSVPLHAIREWIGSNIHAVIHLQKEGEKRLINELLLIQGLEGEVYRILPKYRRSKNSFVK